MDAIISSKCDGLEGVINSSPSKSYSHRAFFLSFLLPPHSQVILDNVLDEGDVSHTIDACRNLGARISKVSDKNYRIIPPPDITSPDKPFDCGNSGTTVRILAALSVLTKGTLTLSGSFFELGRPIDDLIDAMKPIGTSAEFRSDPKNGKKLMDVTTNDILGNYILIRGDISSQYITALIIAACGLNFRYNLLNRKKFDFNEFIIETITPVKSFPYILITQKMVKSYGIDIKINKFEDNRIRIIIPVRNELKFDNEVVNMNIPGDFSSAAFIAAGGALFGKGNGVTINKIDFSDPQGDKKIFHYLKSMGANIKNPGNSILIPGRDIIFGIDGEYLKYLDGIAIGDCSDTPDLFPILCVMASYLKGTTEIRNISHIRLKETDRVAVMVRELRKFNVDIEEFEDKVIIRGMDSFVIDKEITVETEKDHRIIMAFCIFSLGLTFGGKKIKILHAEHVSDSYPDFFNHIKILGYKNNLHFSI